MPLKLKVRYREVRNLIAIYDKPCLNKIFDFLLYSYKVIDVHISKLKFVSAMRTKKRLGLIILASVNDNRAILVRIIVGLIFLSEGIQKFLFPTLMGAGRFLDIGFNHAAIWAYLTGTFEIICGALVLFGLFTRVAAVPLLIIMLTAFVTTKWPVMIHIGFWAMLHEYNTDFALTLLLIYLLIFGSGRWSFDSRILEVWKS